MRRNTAPEFRSLEQMRLSVMRPMLTPPSSITVSQAAEKLRYIDNPGSYVGEWNNDFAPYLVEFMDELTSLDKKGAVFAGPARCGKSDCFLNFQAYTAEYDPVDVYLLHMTQNTARDYSNIDIAKMLRHSKKIGKLVAPGGHNVHDIRWRSGAKTLIKWPSGAELSGKTIVRGWAMDYDHMAQDIDNQGNPFDLLMKRSQTLGMHGMTVAESSPGMDITNPRWIPKTAHEAPPATGILSLYNRGDRRRYYWRCPHCETPFEPVWERIKWEHNSEGELHVYMACTEGCIIEQSEKRGMNRAGRWLKDGQEWLPDGTIRYKPGFFPIQTDIASFWLMGACAAFMTWKEMVISYLAAQADFDRTGDTGPMKKHYNTDRGLPYLPPSLAGVRMPDLLRGKAVAFSPKESLHVPRDVRFLLAQVDVQAGGRPCFVVQIHGFTSTGDVYLIDAFKIRKSKRLDEDGEHKLLDPAAYIEDWDILIDEVMRRSYPLSDGSGRRMMIKMTSCDSGGKEGVTPRAYEFYRSLREKGLQFRFRLIKGESSKTNPRFREVYPDTSNRTDRNAGSRGDIPLVILNSLLLKDQLDNMLKREDPGGRFVLPLWPGEDWLYIQMTAEVRTADSWEKISNRSKNEAWDLAYYALGLALHPDIAWERIDWDSPPEWAAEWDDNKILIFGHEEEITLEKPVVQTFDMAKLAEQYA